MAKKRLSQSERRTQIIEVAMTLFANKGFKGATTRSIAKSAGVSEAIIFRHFATKEDLYDAIIEYTVEKRLAQWDQEVTLENNQDLRLMLKQYAQSIIGRNKQDPTFIRLMMYSALEDHKFREKFIQISRSSGLRAIRKELEKGIQEGRYRPVDPLLTIRSFFATLLQYCISRFVARSRPDQDEAMIDNLIDVFLNGIQPVT